jgi:uncharacterized protein YlxW (UPF0749 family)
MDQRNQAWRRLRHAFRMKPSRAQASGAVLLAVLGFGATVQVQALNRDDDYSTASRSQLIQVLDQLGQKSRVLESDIADKEATRSRLLGSADNTEVAAREAKNRLQTLSILAGTAAARGPGIRLTITVDDANQVGASLIINTLQELRDAGAEAIEINDRVRVVASSYVLDAQGGINVDNVVLPPPYVIEAIGDPDGLATAMGIPGGVEQAVSEKGGKATVDKQETIRITSLHRTTPPRYASPAPDSDEGN